MAYEHLLEIKELKTSFSTERGVVTAVDGVSFHVDAGETVGVVGESGCGKSVTAESILRLLDEKKTNYLGEICYQGTNLLALSIDQMQQIRGNDISMIFQDPMTSLNPVFTIGDQIAEAITQHQKCSKQDAFSRTVELLRRTGIPAPEQRVHEYPHELSGGMRQRAMIAMALACQPNLLIADEPTTALDVTIQAQILELMQELKQESQMGIILITHDLGVVAEVCTRVVVMYLGQVIEEADVETLFENPLHPYTQGLMKAVPTIDGDRKQQLHVIKGMVPSLHQIPQGCRFAPRCEYADSQCSQEPPQLHAISPKQKVRCWHAGNFMTQGEEHELHHAD